MDRDKIESRDAIRRFRVLDSNFVLLEKEIEKRFIVNTVTSISFPQNAKTKVVRSILSDQTKFFVIFYLNSLLITTTKYISFEEF